MPIRLFLTNKLSQWTRSYFVVDGIKYNCCEQWMMAQKAILFGDEETLKAIMAADPSNPEFSDKPWIECPKVQKKLGRKVKGFDKGRWEEIAQDVVYDGNLAKFSQNSELAEFLFDTGDDILAEANPSDPIWGIGLGKDDPRALNQETWQGKNWLGIALMRVREDIKEQIRRAKANKELADRIPDEFFRQKLKEAEELRKTCNPEDLDDD